MPRDQAIMLVAFEGWNDAGSAASEALGHLAEAWDAQHVESMDPEGYYDFQVNRPFVESDADGNRRLVYPSTSLATAHPYTTRPPVVLVQGHEPSFRWPSFCRDLLDQAAEHDIRTLVTVGALLADVPHTRPIPVTTTSESTNVRVWLDLEPSTYEGPVGIVAVLAAEARRRRMMTVSLWAAVPHYVAQPPSPKATLALLEGLERLLGDPVPRGTLVEDAAEWQRGVDELAQQDTEIGDYVRRLEQAKDTADRPEASGDAIAQEFERYLRRRDQGTGG